MIVDGAKVERTFYQTELPELLKNKNITKINGMDKAEFASKLNSIKLDWEMSIINSISYDIFMSA
jgi:hypothetical protein